MNVTIYICCLFSCLLFCPSLTQGQNVNLVPNYSFEDTVKCDLQYTFSYINEWYNPTANTPKAFHICNNEVIIGLSNQFKAKTGHARAVIYLYFVPNPPTEQRDYVAVKLINPLVANKKYCVDFFTLPARVSKYGCNSIGVYFGVGTQFFNTLTIPTVSPQSNLVLTTTIGDTSTWFHYVDIYTASGSETDIMIGNFLPDAQLIIPIINSSSFVEDGADYVIDDVSLHEMTIDIGNDVTICTGTELTIGEENRDTAFNGYYWYHNGVLFDSIVSQKTITFSQPDSFVVEKRLPCGSVWDTIRVDVSYDVCYVKELVINESNVFTPNNDGLNDVFEIKLNGSKYLIKNFEIRNRWGTSIFESELSIFKNTNISDAQNTAKTTVLWWDGRTTSGIDVSEGVYYYLLEVENEKGELVKKNGYISFFR